MTGFTLSDFLDDNGSIRKLLLNPLQLPQNLSKHCHVDVPFHGWKRGRWTCLVGVVCVQGMKRWSLEAVGKRDGGRGRPVR